MGDMPVAGSKVLWYEAQSWLFFPFLLLLQLVSLPWLETARSGHSKGWPLALVNPALQALSRKGFDAIVVAIVGFFDLKKLRPENWRMGITMGSNHQGLLHLFQFGVIFRHVLKGGLQGCSPCSLISLISHDFTIFESIGLISMEQSKDTAGICLLCRKFCYLPQCSCPRRICLLSWSGSRLFAWLLQEYCRSRRWRCYSRPHIYHININMYGKQNPTPNTPTHSSIQINSIYSMLFIRFESWLTSSHLLKRW